MHRRLALQPSLIRAGLVFLIVITYWGMATSFVSAQTGTEPEPSPELRQDKAWQMDTFAPSPAADAMAPMTRVAFLPPSLQTTPLPDTAWRIGITQDGIYELTYTVLNAAGVPVNGADLDAFHLLWQGQEVALDVIDVDSDGIFDTGDKLIFYAEAYHGTTQDEKYTDENVYWLTVDGAAAGKRVTTRSVAPGNAEAGSCEITTTTEQNRVYWARWTNAPQTDTTWFWERVYAPVGFTTTRDYTLTLYNPVTTGYTATLEIEVAARTFNSDPGPDHRIEVAFNGINVGYTEWEGAVGRIATFDAPAGLMQSGVNTVTLEFVADTTWGNQDIYFDRAALTYRRQPVAIGGALVCDVVAEAARQYTASGLAGNARLYDVTDPLNVVMLTDHVAFRFRDTATLGTRYVAAVPETATPVAYQPADLITPTTGADQIMIAPRAFLSALQPLVTHRQAQGLRVKTIAVEDIYPLFNGGIIHPEGIRTLVAHAYQNWPGAAPAYLLLVGDGHFNLKGFNPEDYGAMTPVWIPPYLEFADPDQGEAPVDSRYGDVDGDGFPEIAVGRISVNSASELTTYISKLLAYETAGPGPWMQRALLFADDGGELPENFRPVLEDIATAYFPDWLEIQDVFVDDYCTKEIANGKYANPGENCPAATAAMTQTWSTGAALLLYAGHGAPGLWGHEPLLVGSQLNTLEPMTGYPFLISLDCWDGYWMHPPDYPFSKPDSEATSIGERATTSLSDRGAIAVFGPAGLGYLGIEKPMTEAMLDALFNKGETHLGALTQAGRQAIIDGGAWGHYLARTYTLIGDPAMQIRLQQIRQVFMPLVLRGG